MKKEKVDDALRLLNFPVRKETNNNKSFLLEEQPSRRTRGICGAAQQKSRKNDLAEYERAGRVTM